MVEYKGTARGVDYRSEQYGDSSRTILTFRIEQVDNEGNRRYVPVEMRSSTGISGRLNDGDDVIVTGNMDKNNILKPKSIQVGNTGAIIQTSGHSKWTLIPVLLVIVIPLIIIIIVAISLLK